MNSVCASQLTCETLNQVNVVGHLKMGSSGVELQ